MSFRSYVLRLFILLTVTLFNIVCSSGAPPRFIDILNAEIRIATGRAVVITPADPLAFQTFVSNLNFDGEKDSDDKKIVWYAFKKVPGEYHSDFIATVSTLPDEMTNIRRAQFVLIFSQFSQPLSIRYQYIRELIKQWNDLHDIEIAVAAYGQSLLVQGTLMAAEG